MSRVRKGIALLFNTHHSIRKVFARPWDKAAAPYYLVGSLDNSDGHAGHTRTFRFDRNGVPYRDTPHGRKYAPLIVARYALQMWSIAGLKDDRDARENALKVLPWLLDAADDSGVWDSAGALPPGVPSAIVQGVVLSALSRFASVTRDSGPQLAIERGADRLVAPIEEHGTLDHLPEGPFLEEFATRSHVLNGCVYGLFGLYDLIDGLHYDPVREIARAVEETLIRSLPRFTASNGWSRYALNAYGTAPLASAHYHRSHIRLFTIIGERTAAPSVAATVETWKAAHDRPWTRATVALAKSLQVVWARDVRRLPLR
jgi:hypothetical protein